MIKKRFLMIFLILLCFQYVVLAEDVQQYILGPGDTLDFSVWNHPDLRQQVVVRPDGIISLLPIGEIQVTGKTPHELKDQLTDLLSDLLSSPQVNVSVIGFKQVEVSVLGAVSKPGQFKVLHDTKLLDVLAMAGLEEDVAQLEEVTLTRNSGVIKINVTKLVLEGGHQNYVVQSGDVIFVPTLVREVYILGEIVKPGAYKITSTATPVDVLAMAGGPTKRADLENVLIIHRNANNKSEVINLKDFLVDNQNLSLSYLQNGDIIHVRETKSINWEKIFSYATGIKIIHDLIVNW